MELDQKQGKTIKIGVSWHNYGRSSIDLDTTVVMIDDVGNIKDAVFYNKLTSDCGAIVHSGDKREGREDGYGELITINGAKVKHDIGYLAVLVNAYNGEGFKNIETASIDVLQGNTVI